MMSISGVSKVCSSLRGRTPCECEGRCLGYDSQEECPPLIVFAVQAVELALGKAPSLADVATAPAGAR
jgi:hypothetical protein